MFDYIPEFFKAETADTIEEAEGWYDRQEEQPPSPRAAAPRRGRPRDQLRDQGRPRITARRGLPRHRLAARRRVHPRRLPSMYHQFKELADVDITAEPMEVGPDLPLRDGRGRGRPRHRGEHRRPGCTPRARWPAACTAPTGSAATRCPTCWCSAGAPATTRPTYAHRLADAARRSPRTTYAPPRPRRWRRSRSRTAARTRTRSRRTCRTSCSGWSASSARPTSCEESLDEIEKLKERAKQLARRGAPAVQPGLAPRDRPHATC